jgi:hypothetical protein
MPTHIYEYLVFFGKLGATVAGSDPWYANIINFMVVGYVPLGENKWKHIHESCLHLWDEL